MPSGLPRRRPRTEPERVRNEMAKAGARGAGGRSGAARHVHAPRNVTVYQPPATGGGVEVIGYFYTSTPQIGLLLAFDSMFTLDPATGDSPTGYFTFITSGTFVQVDQDGCYQGHCWVEISGADPGDVFQIEIDRGGNKNGGDSFGVANSAGHLNLTSTTALDFGTGGLDAFNVAVTQIAGTGTTPTLADHQFEIVKF